jgi:ectoine hydroxylase
MTVAEVSTQDQYPTRCSSESALLDRKHPTVWPGVESGPATAEELAAHDRNGYHVVEGLLSPAEVQAHWQELERLNRDEGVRTDERTIVEPTSDQVRSLFEVHKISDLVARLVADPRVLDRARQLLGSDVYIHQSRINYMPGFEGRGFYWHSDFETWHAEDGMPTPRAVSMSVALTDNFAFNGGLMLMPGAHRTFVSCVGETPEDNYKSSLKQQEVGVPTRDDVTSLGYEFGIDQFTGPAGSALWFDSNSMHGSSNNITPYPRSNIFVVFNSVENTLVEPFAAAQRRPEFVASRDFTPLAS